MEKNRFKESCIVLAPTQPLRWSRDNKIVIYGSEQDAYLDAGNSGGTIVPLSQIEDVAILEEVTTLFDKEGIAFTKGVYEPKCSDFSTDDLIEMFIQLEGELKGNGVSLIGMIEAVKEKRGLREFIKRQLVGIHASCTTDKYGQMARHNLSMNSLFGDKAKAVSDFAVEHGDIFKATLYGSSVGNYWAVSEILDPYIKRMCDDAFAMNPNRIRNLNSY